MKDFIRIALYKTWYFFKNPIRHAYWFFARPNMKAVQVVILCNNKFLVIRQNYGHKKWVIPGGSLKKGESFEDAARREIKEEVGLSIYNLKHLGTYPVLKKYRCVDLAIYGAEANTHNIVLDPVEIREASWFGKAELPHPQKYVTEQVDLFCKKVFGRKLRQNDQ